MSTVTSMIYSGGPLYADPASIEEFKQSGVTTVVGWAVHVQPTAELVFNDPPIIKKNEEGQFAYVGEKDWPAQLASLKQGETSVNRILLSIGGWGVGDFPNIQKLIQDHGTGPHSPLYKSFKALKDAVPAVDGIDLDDETLYDAYSTTRFCEMLHELGWEVTFCPYTRTDYWVDLLNTLNSKTPGLVTGFNLQCYSGGAGNDPQTWIDAIARTMGSSFPARSFVYPGLWCRHGGDCSQGDDPERFESQFANWRPDGIRGGFIWLYDDISKCPTSGGLAEYVKAIDDGLGASSQWIKHDNVAEYAGASWENHIETTHSTSVADAMKHADANPEISFFFFCRQYVSLPPHGTFNPGDAVFFSGEPWYGGAPQCDSYQRVSPRWKKVPGVAEYKGATWSNFVRTLHGTTVEKAKQFAASDSDIEFFFFCNQTVILPPHGVFEAGDAVFFSGKPWYGSAPQCDAYEKEPRTS